MQRVHGARQRCTVGNEEERGRFPLARVERTSARKQAREQARSFSRISSENFALLYTGRDIQHFFEYFRRKRVLYVESYVHAHGEPRRTFIERYHDRWCVILE